MTVLITYTKNTDQFLDAIEQTLKDQKYTNTDLGFVSVGDSLGNIVMMEADRLEKDKYYWRQGKIIRKGKT